MAPGRSLSFVPLMSLDECETYLGDINRPAELEPVPRRPRRTIGKGEGTGPRPFDSSPPTNDADVLRIVSRASHGSVLHLAVTMLVKAAYGDSSMSDS